jgi:hypothetical protein
MRIGGQPDRQFFTLGGGRHHSLTARRAPTAQPHHSMQCAGYSMPKYWWQCMSCGARPTWLTVCHSRSIAAFIWDELAPSGWDQRLLLRRCKCKRRSLRITYRFRRGDPERISVKHIVGLGPDGDYLPMLWETFRHSSPRTHWIDFKY